MNKECKNILKSSSILLVEDNIQLREKFCRLLSLYVECIYETDNGVDALKVYAKNKPSIIITDIEMPQMDGLEFIKIIRQENSKIPIIVTSAYSNREYLLESIKLFLVDYLIKPIKHDDLMVALESSAKILQEDVLSNNINIKGCNYDSKNKQIIVDGINCRLTNSEMALIELLILNRGNLVTKIMCEDKIYSKKEMSDSALKNIVFKLRKKIGRDIITTVDKLGYMIE